MSRPILLSAPDVGALEERFLLDALRSGWVAPIGPDLDAFERELADLAAVDHAVALNSGTAALHLALLAHGIGRRHTVLVPTLTFAATANAVVYTGAEPFFVDCDTTGNVDVDLVSEALSQLSRHGRCVGAVVSVDLFGRCANYSRLLPVCAAYGVPLIEDAAEAVGATHGGQPAGGFGAAGVFSFNGNKIMTTGGGGAVLCHEAAVAQRCRYLASQARQPVVHYEHTEVGYNYRLSNVLAAIGRAQLRRLPQLLARRWEIRRRYLKAFDGADGIAVLGTDGGIDDAEANAWLTVVVVDPARTGWSAADLGRRLDGEGIEIRPVWKPMHAQPAFAGAEGMVRGVAERLFRCGLVLPGGSALTDADIDRVLHVIDEFRRERG